LKSTDSGYWTEIQQNTKQGTESTEIGSWAKNDEQKIYWNIDISWSPINTKKQVAKNLDKAHYNVIKRSKKKLEILNELWWKVWFYDKYLNCLTG